MRQSMKSEVLAQMKSRDSRAVDLQITDLCTMRLHVRILLLPVPSTFGRVVAHLPVEAPQLVAAV
jgi:hypothetical protein